MIIEDKRTQFKIINDGCIDYPDLYPILLDCIHCFSELYYLFRVIYECIRNLYLKYNFVFDNEITFEDEERYCDIDLSIPNVLDVSYSLLEDGTFVYQIIPFKINWWGFVKVKYQDGPNQYYKYFPTSDGLIFDTYTKEVLQRGGSILEKKLELYVGSKLIYETTF
jgi:hypothetical protein